MVLMINSEQELIMENNSVISSVNVNIYINLYRIEVGLRELIIDSLSSQYGSKWVKNLPDDIKKKMSSGKEYENKAAWIDFISFHPIYYADFTDLVKIIEQSDKWKDVFSNYFGRKEIISSTLKELEPIRNKIAHNRKASESDLAITESAISKLESWLKPDYLNELTNRCTYAKNMKELLGEVKTNMDSIQALIICLREVDDIVWWRCISSEWWFDTEYIGIPVEPISEFMQKVQEYIMLPRNRGCGYIIEKWITDNDLSEYYKAANDSIKKILEV